MHIKVQLGSVILKEKPFVYVLSSKSRTERCDYCFNRGQLLKCSQCHYVYYCDKTCQTVAWAVHKYECLNFKKVAPLVVPDSARLLARIIKKLEKGGNQIKSYLSESSSRFRTFKDLMSHYPDVKNDSKRMEHFNSLCGVLNKFLGDSFIPNPAELLGIYGKMCINSFNINDQEMRSIGTGIYLAASVLDHSCAPNAVPVFQGTTLEIRAIENMSNLDFSKVFISYIDVLATPRKRQEELLKAYYFLCECPKCLNEKELRLMTAAACPISSCKGYIETYKGEKDASPLHCLECHCVASKEFLDEFNDVCQFTQTQIDNMKNMTYFDVCKVCLLKHKGLLYSMNILHVKILDLAFECSIDLELWNDAVEFGKELVDKFR
ncbi:histone-lysine N-methyltransferase SMYD3 [Agrilus planipennis]|uniref:Histone-lysine N-methyltransferase SMYD3 n=1 Tax=Agrilus planipennis TaxID=224129 RepID=A0A7F5RHP8_AGRPL|nr:histone-lysine N-methyltransferase SMYD3 [Agrilus planipennis]